VVIVIVVVVVNIDNRRQAGRSQAGGYKGAHKGAWHHRGMYMVTIITIIIMPHYYYGYYYDYSY